MGRTYLTIRKRRKNERKILSVKKEPFKHVKQQAPSHHLKSSMPSIRNCNQMLRTYGPDQQTLQHHSSKTYDNEILSSLSSEEMCGSENSEHHSESICSESNNDHALYNPEIDLNPDCSTCLADDHELSNWKFSFYSLEFPNIDTIGMDTGLMTINPVNDPFHYMSVPVLSAFGLVFPNMLQELRYSYMNLIQTLNTKVKWFLLPSDDNTILLSKHDFNSTLAPVITMTIEIHHTRHWFLRHSTGILMQHQHPLLATLPTPLQSGHDIKMVTDTIDECYDCKGISDPKYYPLVVKNKGKFYDFKGLWLLILHLYYFKCLYFRREVVGIL